MDNQAIQQMISDIKDENLYDSLIWLSIIHDTIRYAIDTTNHTLELSSWFLDQGK